MSDHRNHRHRASEPAWPTGDDPEPSARNQERTGFWSPLWDEDDDAPASKPSGGHARRAQPNGQPTSHARNGSNGHARKDGGSASGQR